MTKSTLTIALIICLESLLNAQRLKNCRECIDDIEPIYRAKISKLQADKLKVEQELYGYRSGKIKPPTSSSIPPSPIICKENYWRGRFNTANSQLIIYKNRLAAANDTIDDNVKEKSALETSLRSEIKRTQDNLDKSLTQIDKRDSTILALSNDKEKSDSTLFEREKEKVIVTKLYGKNSLQVFAEYTPRLGKKRYIPLDFENPVKEAANLDRDVKIDVQRITRLVIVGSVLLEDDTERLRGDIFLKFKDESNVIINKSVSIDFIKQSEKIGESSVFTCRFNDASLIWDKTSKRKKRTILNNNEDYTIEIVCKDQKHSTKFRLD